MSTAQAQKEQQIKNAHDPVGDQSSVKMSFPVDLNQLFTLSYSFDALKSALEYLCRETERQEFFLTDLKKYDRLFLTKFLGVLKRRSLM